jgi:hypothetical protein
MGEKWDVVPRVSEGKRIECVTIKYSDGSVDVFPRDFADKRGVKGKFGESGKAAVLAVYVAGRDGDDYVSVLRGVYSKQLITVMARDLENW